MGKHKGRVHVPRTGKHPRLDGWTRSCQPSQNGPSNTPSQQTHPAQGWFKPTGLSSKFDILLLKGPSDLTIGQHNVRKIGKVKRQLLENAL